ncbi:MAG: thioredoxin family protein [Clostridium sp.]|nr:thioredoxin family protein [Clostridium sp.]
MMKIFNIRVAIAMALSMLAGMSLAKADAPQHVRWTSAIDSLSPTSGKIVWSADIDAGWHIYGMEAPKHLDFPLTLTTFTVEPAEGLKLGEVMPSKPATTHVDDILNAEIPWWEGKVEFEQEFELTGGATGAEINSEVSYMVCNDASCTPPAKEKFSLRFGTDIVPSAPAEKTESANASKAPAAEMTEEEQAWWEPVNGDINSEANGAQNSWLAIFLMSLAGGFLALLTPCVWPMIPMTISFFLKSNKNKRRGTVNALLYALSIIVIFMVLGIAVTIIFGASKLNAMATSAGFNVAFFIILVIFAISFFGAFDIKLPSKWTNAVDAKADNTTGLLSIFFMAFTLVLVSFSCTGPIIGTLLVEAASDGSKLGPAIGMGGFALGLAIPFGLFAFFPSMLKSMPKSGGWLNSVKVVLGFIELILALKFLSVADMTNGWRILDREVFLSIWIVLFALLGMYLLGKLRFSHDDESKHTTVPGFFLAIISFSFAVYLLPGLWGAPLKATSAFVPPMKTQDFNLYGGEYHVFDDYDEGMAYAKAEGKPVLMDFTGYGCVNCRKMEAAVFDTPGVRQLIEDNYVMIQLYVDDTKKLKNPYTVEENGKEVEITTVGEKWSYLQRHKFGIASQPYYVILDNQGRPLAPSREYNENVAEFEKWLNAGLSQR